MTSAVGLRLEGVRIVRDGAVVVRDANAGVPAGEVTALTGPNGAGKSTLIAAILGFVPYDGRLVFTADGRETKTRPRIGYVPQRFAPDRHLPLTVLEFLAAGRQRRPLWLFGPRADVRARVLGLLDAVKAGSVATRPLGELSGGELQRVLLANALLADPELLILDEPDSGVDVAGGDLFCELLERLRAERGFTQLMVSHNIALVAAHASHAILMNRTVLAEGSPGEVFTPGRLEGAFGVHMAGFARMEDCVCGCKSDRTERSPGGVGGAASPHVNNAVPREAQPNPPPAPARPKADASHDNAPQGIP